MMCRVLGCQDPEALRLAMDLGIAMQLTNVCRDVQADVEAGRRYLPASRVGNVDPQALVHPAPSLHANLHAGVDHFLNTSAQSYQSGEAALAHLPFGARFGILLAVRAYRDIGTRLRLNRNAYRLGRTVVKRRIKFRLAAQALVSAPERRSFWLLAKQHDASLHSELTPFPMTDTSFGRQHV